MFKEDIAVLTGEAPLGADVPAPAANEQLVREMAEIESATAALRKAEPALQTWTKAPASSRKPRPVWLIIGALWLSTALVTAGAVVAIAILAG